MMASTSYLLLPGCSPWTHSSPTKPCALKIFHDLCSSVSSPHKIKVGCIFVYPPSMPAVCALPQCWQTIMQNCQNELSIEHVWVHKHQNRSLVTGWCLTPTLLLICSSFSRENGHIFLICSSRSGWELENQKSEGRIFHWTIAEMSHPMHVLHPWKGAWNPHKCQCQQEISPLSGWWNYLN